MIFIFLNSGIAHKDFISQKNACINSNQFKHHILKFGFLIGSKIILLYNIFCGLWAPKLVSDNLYN